MTIECEEAVELLAAYAMNRLEREEQAAVSEHLASCRLHDAELAELRALIAALPLDVNNVAPPARLRSSLLSAFDREIAPAHKPAAPARQPRAGVLGRLWRSPRFAYALAAVLAAISIGLAVWNVSLQSGREDLLVRTYDQGGMTLRVIYLEAEEVAILEVSMPALRPDQTYQAWKIPESGAPISLGVLESQGAFAFDTSLEGIKAIAISVEPSGGSLQPTTTPVVVQEL